MKDGGGEGDRGVQRVACRWGGDGSHGGGWKKKRKEGGREQP